MKNSVKKYVADKEALLYTTAIIKNQQSFRLVNGQLITEKEFRKLHPMNPPIRSVESLDPRKL